MPASRATRPLKPPCSFRPEDCRRLFRSRRARFWRSAASRGRPHPLPGSVPFGGRCAPGGFCGRRSVRDRAVQDPTRSTSCGAGRPLRSGFAGGLYEDGPPAQSRTDAAAERAADAGQRHGPARTGRGGRTRRSGSDRAAARRVPGSRTAGRPFWGAARACQSAP